MLLFTEIEAKYDKKMKSLREELELRRKTEIHEIEEVRNIHVQTWSLHVHRSCWNFKLVMLFKHHLSRYKNLTLVVLCSVFQRKNGQINTLMKNHEKAFSDIKNYYNDITLNNLALINSLKVLFAAVAYTHYWNLSFNLWTTQHSVHTATQMLI